MRVATNVLALLGAATLAAASPTPVVTPDFVGPLTGGTVAATTDVAVRSEDTEVLAKREIVAAIVTAFGTAAATAAAEAAVKAAVTLIGQISNWDQVGSPTLPSFTITDTEQRRPVRSLPSKRSPRCRLATLTARSLLPPSATTKATTLRTPVEWMARSLSASARVPCTPSKSAFYRHISAPVSVLTRYTATTAST